VALSGVFRSNDIGAEHTFIVARNVGRSISRAQVPYHTTGTSCAELYDPAVPGYGGDTRWLRSLWPAVKSTIRFAWECFARWDADRGGVMEGVQHKHL